MKKETKTTRLTFSKKLIMMVLILAEVDLQAIIILGYFGLQTLENIGVAIVTEILGTALIYCIKAYFETKQEKKQDFEQYRFDKYIVQEDNKGE